MLYILGLLCFLLATVAGLIWLHRQEEKLAKDFEELLSLKEAQSNAAYQASVRQSLAKLSLHYGPTP